MGYTKIDNRLRREIAPRLKLRPSDVAVYEALAGRANKDGACWPSRETLAREAGVSTGTVYTACRRLASTGLIEMEVSHGRRGNRFVVPPINRVIHSLREPVNPSTTDGFAQPVNPSESDAPTRQNLTQKDYPVKDEYPPRGTSPSSYPRPPAREGAPADSPRGEIVQLFPKRYPTPPGHNEWLKEHQA